MSGLQTILKTVATTIDVLVALIIVIRGQGNDMKMAYTVFCLLNLIGIWA